MHRARIVGIAVAVLAAAWVGAQTASLRLYFDEKPVGDVLVYQGKQYVAVEDVANAFGAKLNMADGRLTLPLGGRSGRIWIPGFADKDGRIVPGHYAGESGGGSTTAVPGARVRTPLQGDLPTTREGTGRAVDLAVGQPALSFRQRAIDGRSVRFPADYRGRLVMLDFWATWCGPCRAEIPGLVKAYEKYHGQGFEVLGISLDRPNDQAKVEAFLAANNMPWPQVYDGGYWNAEVAKLYGVHAIPHAILVDGDTGKIVADENSLRGLALDRTIARTLAARR